jgi:hypothetical protein
MIILRFIAGAVAMIGYTLFVYHSGKIAGIKAALANEGREAIEHPVSNKDENYKLTTGATNK